jgi:hypothetical protein
MLLLNYISSAPAGWNAMVPCRASPTTNLICCFGSLRKLWFVEARGNELHLDEVMNRWVRSGLWSIHMGAVACRYALLGK